MFSYNKITILLLIEGNFLILNGWRYNYTFIILEIYDKCSINIYIYVYEREGEQSRLKH